MSSALVLSETGQDNCHYDLMQAEHLHSSSPSLNINIS